ncbi:aldehyde dehydrogenase family protein [Ktedonosporobacter rubrisoli]|uniref:Aldehyde dehydrogenase family protein n=1 Tax=Ktedonosporobacter rubrisoli TaxID=2509675 RepID=A0A4P6K2R7_KTERU|nr:aldehyde dehydrogenase family protein [Ktedonosporobacter rubrisoli]QBD82325.1 aldehyde dehydrogenase family protein [Ktedonosporobacter rubrisoli]
MKVMDIFETMDYGPAPEAPTPALEWLQKQQAFGLFINNRWVKPNSGQYLESTNPATGKSLVQVASANQADVDAAVEAAQAAFEIWSKTPGHIRARYLYALARHIQKHSRLLAVLEALDNGKSIRETRDIDIPLVARHFYYHAGWAQLMTSELPDYRPLGVVGQIIPWNFPLLMLAWKIAPAIAMGNTVVLKPARYTPLTALKFAEIVQEVGLPAGVINILTGEASQVGEALVRHPGIKKIAFTGSTEVGRNIRRTTAGSGKKLSLELGGKSPFIVFDDADLDSVVEGVVDAIWFNQGQVCCAGSRLLVQEDIAECLLAKLRVRMERLRVGDSLDKAVDMGAIVSPAQLKEIQRLVQQGLEEGAQMWQPSWACPTEGYFFPPTLFTNVTPASTIAQVEIFGPVLVAMTFRTPAEAVALANNTRYGLAASIWSENINLALDVAPKLKAGSVWINCTNLFDASSGFGGYRESGYGREGGKEGLYEYVQPAWKAEPQATKAKRAAQAQAGKSAKQNGDGGVTELEADAQEGAVEGQAAVNGYVPHLPAIDRTPKLFIKGKQTRPDSGYSRPIYEPAGRLIGEVGEGNRKDIRNAVEAAHAASSWAAGTAHNRAQILYYIAENLAVREDEFARRIAQQVGCSYADALSEVQVSLSRLFSYAAWTDKYEGSVHRPPLRGVVLALPEPRGVMGLACPDENPLLGFVSLVAPAIAMGNTVIVIPSPKAPLSATDFYQVLETSDVPAGVVNIVTGDREALSKVLAEHDDVDAMWYFGSPEGSRQVELASTGNMKYTWVNHGRARDWLDVKQGEGEEFLREATQVKNIWVPYGE